MIDFSDLEDDFDAIPTTSSTGLYAKTKQYPCGHCGGTGKYQGVRVYQERSDCFACRGKGFFLTSEADRRKAKLTRQAKADADRAKKREAGIEQLTAALGEQGYQWLANAGNWSQFYGGLHSKALQYGSLSDKQLACAVSGWAKQQARDAERAAAKAAREADAPVIDLTRIRELFDAALESGLAKPALVINGLRLSLAPANGKNAGSLYVKDSGDYAGKISPEGKFFAIREARAEIAQELQALAADPLAALTAHGHQTGQCSCCGRLLTNAESVRLGIGPICRGRWGL